jgi:hypothetical protein
VDHCEIQITILLGLSCPLLAPLGELSRLLLDPSNLTGFCMTVCEIQITILLGLSCPLLAPLGELSRLLLDPSNLTGLKKTDVLTLLWMLHKAICFLSAAEHARDRSAFAAGARFRGRSIILLRLSSPLLAPLAELSTFFLDPSNSTGFCMTDFLALLWMLRKAILRVYAAKPADRAAFASLPSVVVTSPYPVTDCSDGWITVKYKSQSYWASRAPF